MAASWLSAFAIGDGARPPRVRGRRPDGERSLVLLVATTLLLAGCVLGEGRAEDTMTIHNRTDAPIAVTYEVVANGRVIAEIVTELSPRQQSFLSPQLFGSNRCLPGEFVARSGNKVVDRLPQPCKEQVWEVTGHPFGSNDLPTTQ